MDNEQNYKILELRKELNTQATYRFNKLKKQTQNELKKYTDDVELFKDEEIFTLQLKTLEENCLAIIDKNSYAYEYQKSQSDIKINQQLIKSKPLDSKTLNATDLHKELAIRRHRLVKEATAYDLAKYKYDYFSKKQKQYIDYKFALDAAKLELFEKTEALNPNFKNYQEFYDEVEQKYDELASKKRQYIEEFFKYFKPIAKDIYQKFSFKEKLTELQQYNKDLKKLFNEFLDLTLQEINKNNELKIIELRIKEKEVPEKEINVLNDEIKVLRERIKELKSKIRDVENKHTQLQKEIKKEKLDNSKNLKFKEDTLLKDTPEAIQKILYEAKLTFTDYDNAFNKLNHLLHTHLTKDFPKYENFYAAQEKEYEASLAKHIQEQLKVNPDEPAYQLKEEEYLKKLLVETKDDVASESVETVKEHHQAEIQRINDEYAQNIKQIKEKKAERKQIYLEKKKDVKLRKKLVSTTEAKDLKEILSIYKKEIKAGDNERKAKAKQEKNEKLKDAAYRASLETAKITSPKTNLITLEYQKTKTSEDKEYKTQYVALRKNSRNEVSISRYRKNMTRNKREEIIGYGFLSIWAIGFLVFTLIPLIYTIFMSFSSVTTDNAGWAPVISLSGGKLFPNWVGWRNYENRVMFDYNFFYTYFPTLIRSLFLFVPIIIFIAFVLGILLNTKIAGRTFFRIIYFLPVIIVSGPLFNYLNNNTTSQGGSSLSVELSGSITTILNTISGDALEFANNIFSNFSFIMWLTGIPIVLFISGLQKIDRSLYEAAEIDGANKWQSLWNITFPLIKSVMLVATLFIVLQITSFSKSNPFITMMGQFMSSPDAGSGETAANLDLGVAAAIGWIQTIIVLIFVGIVFLLFRDKTFNDKQKSFEEFEKARLKKEKRRERLHEFFHIEGIKMFFSKLFGPMRKVFAKSKANRKKRREERGI